MKSYFSIKPGATFFLGSSQTLVYHKDDAVWDKKLYNIMIVIPNKNFTADSIHLVQLLNSTTKVNMLKACDKLDLYVSPNLKKDETVRRIAQEMLDNPIEILSRLNKQELQIVDEFVKGDANTYVVRKMRKTQYKLQKLFLVTTYEDKENQEWHMLMPSELTKALSTSLNFYLDMANKGVKAPSAKQLRMMSALSQLFDGKEL